MGSEQSKQIAAIEHFDNELDSLMPPVTKESLKRATKHLLINLFTYSSAEADARVEMLDIDRSIPDEAELNDNQGSFSECLKVALFDKLPMDFIIHYGKKEFDAWIGGYLRSLLRGHITESPSYEHLEECPERFCPELVMHRMVRGKLCDEQPDTRDMTDYIAYTDETIYVNIKTVKELVALDVYDEVDAKMILSKYRNKLDLIEVCEYPLTYSEDLFE